MEEQIIDATTEDGLKQLRELDAAAKAEAEAEGEAGTGAAAELA